MKQARVIAVRFMAVGVLVAACAGPAVSLPPAPPTIHLVGMLADARIADPERIYILEDGRQIKISTADIRVAFEGGPGHPFVQGIDADGPFVAVFSGQEGRPDDCHIIPANGGQGIERGAFIELEGILWRKDAAFTSEVARSCRWILRAETSRSCTSVPPTLAMSGSCALVRSRDDGCS